jgi:hypothetical protein
MLMTGRRWIMLGTVAVAGLAATLASVLPAVAAVSTSARHLQNETGPCLDASGQSAVRLVDACTGASSRLWRFRAVTGSELDRVQRPGLASERSSYFRVVNRKTGRCLALVDSAGKVGQRSCGASGFVTVWGVITSDPDLGGALRLNSVAAFDRGLPVALAAATDGSGRVVLGTVGSDVASRFIWSRDR